MCTLVLFHLVSKKFPLVVLAVRDEALTRESARPVLLSLEHPIVAPLDVQAGGTWFGARSDYYMCALTNQEDGTHRRGCPSRGLIVRESLVERSSWAATRREPSAYNPYNLVDGEPGNIKLTTVVGKSVTTRMLRKGVHVICNDEIGGTFDVKKGRVAEMASHVDFTSAESVLESLRTVSSDHTLSSEDPYLATCVHTPEYGTRSVSVLLFSVGKSTPQFFHAEEPACSGQPFEDHTALFPKTQ